MFQALLLPETACPIEKPNHFSAPVGSAHRTLAAEGQTPIEVFHFKSNTQADQEGPVPSDSLAEPGLASKLEGAVYGRLRAVKRHHTESREFLKRMIVFSSD